MAEKRRLLRFSERIIRNVGSRIVRVGSSRTRRSVSSPRVSARRRARSARTLSAEGVARGDRDGVLVARAPRGGALGIAPRGARGAAHDPRRARGRGRRGPGGAQAEPLQPGVGVRQESRAAERGGVARAGPPRRPHRHGVRHEGPLPRGVGVRGARAAAAERRDVGEVQRRARETRGRVRAGRARERRVGARGDPRVRPERTGRALRRARVAKARGAQRGGFRADGVAPGRVPRVARRSRAPPADGRRRVSEKTRPARLY